MTIDEISKPLDIKINKGQEKAIEKTEGYLQIIAGPGTGKTQTLILRTLNLLLRTESPIEPKYIALLTFTEKAGYELKERLFYSISNN